MYIYIYIYIYIYVCIYIYIDCLAALGLRCSAWAFFSSSEPGLLIAGASHSEGFSCCRAQALGAQASVVMACGLQ